MVSNCQHARQCCLLYYFSNQLELEGHWYWWHLSLVLLVIVIYCMNVGKRGSPSTPLQSYKKEVNDFTNKLSKTAVVSFSLCLNNSTILAKYCCSAAIWSLQSYHFSQNLLMKHFIFQGTVQRDVFWLLCLKNLIFSKWAVYKSTIHLKRAVFPCAIMSDLFNDLLSFVHYILLSHWSTLHIRTN